jgi:ribosomal protein S18 acetylase RimI-like enzyme
MSERRTEAVNQTAILESAERTAIGSIMTIAAGDAEAACIAVIQRAFADDPGVRWMYPDPDQYRECFPSFVRAFAGRAFEQGTAQVADGFAAAALWLPPGVQPDEEALVVLVEGTVAEEDREAVFSVFEQLGAYHPSEPHWHLPLIGTDPARQGRGHGSALLRHRLRACDRERTPAYLEATSLRSVPLYQRHGFEVLGTVRAGTSPPITPMLRRPR